MNRLHASLKAIEGRALARFNVWFTSQGGVYQTFLVTLMIVLAERAFPRLDPNGFWLLYWLTVYSAVTQPALAYATAQDADRLQDRLDRLERKLDQLIGEAAG